MEDVPYLVSLTIVFKAANIFSLVRVFISKLIPTFLLCKRAAFDGWSPNNGTVMTGVPVTIASYTPLRPQ